MVFKSWEGYSTFLQNCIKYFYYTLLLSSSVVAFYVLNIKYAIKVVTDACAAAFIKAAGIISFCFTSRNNNNKKKMHPMARDAFKCLQNCRQRQRWLWSRCSFVPFSLPAALQLCWPSTPTSPSLSLATLAASAYVVNVVVPLTF